LVFRNNSNQTIYDYPISTNKPTNPAFSSGVYFCQKIRRAPFIPVVIVAKLQNLNQISKMPIYMLDTTDFWEVTIK
jgi:hypothetical protein